MGIKKHSVSGKAGKKTAVQVRKSLTVNTSVPNSVNGNVNNPDRSLQLYEEILAGLSWSA